MGFFGLGRKPEKIEKDEQHMSVGDLDFVVAFFHNQVFVEATNITHQELLKYRSDKKFEEQIADKTKFGTFARLMHHSFSALQQENRTGVKNWYVGEPMINAVYEGPVQAKAATEKLKGVMDAFRESELKFLSGESKYSGETEEKPTKEMVVQGITDIILTHNPANAAGKIYDQFLKEYLEKGSESKAK